jgi:hypothetical protein
MAQGKAGSSHRGLVDEMMISNFLLTALKNGPVAVSDLDRLARAAGLLLGQRPIGQSKAFRSARTSLGIKPFQRGRAWHWSLPETPSCGSDAPVVASDAPPVYNDLAGDNRPKVSDAPSSQQNDPFEDDSASDFASDDPSSQDLVEAVPTDARVLDWTAEIRRLDPNRPASGINRLTWRSFLETCHYFLATWASRASLQQWTEHQLFGIVPADPVMCGLVWRLAAGNFRLVEIDRGGAVIESPGGTRKFIAKPRPNQKLMLPWHLT